MKIGYVTHEESTIQHFMEEPEFADYLMNDVFADGDSYEINSVKSWYDEARVRSILPEAVNA